MANPFERWRFGSGVDPNQRAITRSDAGRPVGGASDFRRINGDIPQRTQDIRLQNPDQMEQLLASMAKAAPANLPTVPARGTGTTIPTGSLVQRILSTLGLLPDLEAPAVSEPSLGVQRPRIDPTTQRSQYQPPEVANIDDPSGTGGRIRGREEMLDPNFLSSQTKGPIPNANLALQFLDRLLNDPERNLRQVIDQGASGLQPFMGQSGQNQDWLDEARLENLRKEIMNLSRGVTQATQERDAFSQGPVQFPQVHRPIRPTWSPN